MPWKQKGRRGYQMDVWDRQGRRLKNASCGTEDPDEANRVAQAVDRWRGSREVGGPILAAIVDKEIALADAYEADCEGKLESFLAAHRARRAAKTTVVVDLDPLVAQWAKTGVREQVVQYVRRFIPEGVVFPIEQFRLGPLTQFLDTLRTMPKAKRRDDETEAAFLARATRPASNATKNRYRSALSVLNDWLLRMELVDRDWVSATASYTEKKALPVHLTRKQTEAVLKACEDDELRCVVALLAQGAEWGAVEKAIRADVDLANKPPVFVAHPAGRGEGKTKYRGRVVALTEKWLLPYVTAHLDRLLPDERIVLRDYDETFGAHERAVAKAGVPRVTPHDWRHVYAITALKRKDDHQDIKRNLGHSPRSTLLYTTYGPYINDPRALPDEPAADGPDGADTNPR